MILISDVREKMRFILLGMAKIWGFVLLIVVPCAVIGGLTLLIARRSEDAAVLFLLALSLTVVGGYFGYGEYDRKQYKMQREREEAERAAEREEWTAALDAARGRNRTGTSG